MDGGNVEMGKEQDMLKLEIAKELGLGEKVLKYGWKSLSAKETGKIGGLVSKRRKSLEKTEG
jgi:small acid-soluble spore protein F (minor alpha/beta-type SASP)